MLLDPTPFTREQVADVEVKLQAFFEALAPDERLILQALLLDACGDPQAAHCLLLSEHCSRFAAAPAAGEGGSHRGRRGSPRN